MIRHNSRKNVKDTFNNPVEALFTTNCAIFFHIGWKGKDFEEAWPGLLSRSSSKVFVSRTGASCIFLIRRKNYERFIKDFGFKSEWFASQRKVSSRDGSIFVCSTKVQALFCLSAFIFAAEWEVDISNINLFTYKNAYQRHIDEKIIQSQKEKREQWSKNNCRQKKLRKYFNPTKKKLEIEKR